MSHNTKEARARANAAFDKMQTQALKREKMVSERDAAARQTEDKTARLKAQRLKRHAASAEPAKSSSEG